MICSPDGVVMAAEVPEGKGEGEGAITVYLSAAAAARADLLPMGAVEHAVVSESQRRLLILPRSPFMIGLVLSPPRPRRPWSSPRRWPAWPEAISPLLFH